MAESSAIAGWTTGEWHHVLICRAAGALTAYRNTSSILTHASTLASFPDTDGGLLQLGKQYDQTGTLDGVLDEFRIYHKALSSDERTQNYNHGAVAHGKTIIE